MVLCVEKGEKVPGTKYPSWGIERDARRGGGREQQLHDPSVATADHPSPRHKGDAETVPGKWDSRSLHIGRKRSWAGPRSLC